MLGRTTFNKTNAVLRASLVVAIMSAVCLLALGPVNADSDRPAGLLWNRTGLPAVFPLQIKTTPGADYLVMLSDSSTNEEALAAYARGGEFFRVLVPPGLFDIQIYYGTNWRGEEERFGTGPETGTITLPDPLLFSVKGLDRKSGHLIDLRDVVRRTEETARVKPIDLCQNRQTVAAGRLPSGEAETHANGILDIRTIPPTNLRALGPRLRPEPGYLTNSNLTLRERNLAELRYKSLKNRQAGSPELPKYRFRQNFRMRPCW